MSKKQIGHGHGYGKTILFGEHFVVYGLPAIVAALGGKTEATVQRLESSEKTFELIDNRPKYPHFAYRLKNEYHQLIKNILQFAGIKQALKITLSGDLTVCSGGIGASAACATAIARAVNDCFDLQWDDEIINQVAYHGEKVIHGNPSGIDNTAAVFGGVFSFTRDVQNKQHGVKKLIFKRPVEIVLADSGMVNNTKEVVALVKKITQKNPVFAKKLFQNFATLFSDAQDSLQSFDLKTLGILMNKNHELLQKLNISCKKLDEMVVISRDVGALGAKLTGTGKGGLMLALTPGKELQDTVAKKLQDAGYFVFKTSISSG